MKVKILGKNSYYYRQWSRPILKSTVLFQSFNGNPLIGEILEYANKLQFTNKMYIVYNSGLKVKNFFKNTKYIKFKSKKYFKMLARAELIIVNNTFWPAFSNRLDQKVINTWHGSPIKVLGLNINGNAKWKISNVQRSFILSDKIILDNEITSDELISGYAIPNIHFHKFNYFKLRDTNLLTPSKNYNVVAYYTWQEIYLNNPNIFFQKIKQLSDFLNRIDSKISLSVSLHHTINNKKIRAKFKKELKNVIIIDPKEMQDEIIKRSGLVISDFSSIIFDLAKMKANVLLDHREIKEYGNDRGIIEDNLNLIESKVAYSNNELYSLLKEWFVDKNMFRSKILDDDTIPDSSTDVSNLHSFKYKKNIVNLILPAQSSKNLLSFLNEYKKLDSKVPSFLILNDTIYSQDKYKFILNFFKNSNIYPLYTNQTSVSNVFDLIRFNLGNSANLNEIFLRRVIGKAHINNVYNYDLNFNMNKIINLKNKIIGETTTILWQNNLTISNKIIKNLNKNETLIINNKIKWLSKIINNNIKITYFESSIKSQTENANNFGLQEKIMILNEEGKITLWIGIAKFILRKKGISGYKLIIRNNKSNFKIYILSKLQIYNIFYDPSMIINELNFFEIFN